MAIKVKCGQCGVENEIADGSTPDRCSGCSHPIVVPVPAADTAATSSDSSKASEGIGSWVIGGLIVLALLFAWLGLWLVVGIAALAAIALGIAAMNSQDDDMKNGCWIAAGACAVIAFVVWLFIPAGTPQKDKVANSQKSSSAEQSRGERTLAYWNSLRSTFPAAGSQPRNVDEGVNVLESTVARIDALPTSGVDPDAVECGSALRRLLRVTASELRRLNSPEHFLESFVRGYQGDVLGPIVEYSQTNSAINQQASDVQDLLARARAMLSSRYGIEFPPIQ